MSSSHFIVKIIRNGNSNCIILPAHICRDHKIGLGREYVVDYNGETLLIHLGKALPRDKIPVHIRRVVKKIRDTLEGGKRIEQAWLMNKVFPKYTEKTKEEFIQALTWMEGMGELVWKDHYIHLTNNPVPYPTQVAINKIDDAFDFKIVEDEKP